MTTAFVLGGGGLLGAHEVGMLRALFVSDLEFEGFTGLVEAEGVYLAMNQLSADYCIAVGKPAG